MSWPKRVGRWGEAPRRLAETLVSEGHRMGASVQAATVSAAHDRGLEGAREYLLRYHQPHGEERSSLVDARDHCVPLSEAIFIDSFSAPGSAYDIDRVVDPLQLVDFDGTTIADIARSAIGEISDPTKIVCALYDFVKSRTTYVKNDKQYGVGNYWASAAETFLHKQGDCACQAILFGALCQGVGLATRHVCTPGHALCQVLLPDISVRTIAKWYGDKSNPVELATGVNYWVAPLLPGRRDGRRAHRWLVCDLTMCHYAGGRPAGEFSRVIPLREKAAAAHGGCSGWDWPEAWKHKVPYKSITYRYPSNRGSRFEYLCGSQVDGGTADAPNAACMGLMYAADADAAPMVWLPPCCLPATFVRIGEHRGKPCVVVGNSAVSVKVATSGCQIVSILPSEGTTAHNPLWEPPWSTTTAALRKVAVKNASCFSQASDDVLESELLSCIGGHSLCLDVFGAHSKGEVEHSGLSFHGEAGLRTFEVTDVGDNGSSVTLSAHLRESMLQVTRTFTPCPKGGAVVRVCETIKNLVGFERALGRSQHVSLGTMADDRTDGSFCSPSTFNTNATRGVTWPEDNGEYSVWAVDTQFDVDKGLPRKDGGREDWFTFPRGGTAQSDLCTLNIPATDTHGWFTCCHGDGDHVLAYVWERASFPWLMTWEEHRARQQAPWSGRTSVRGLEFGSYALATGRKANVQMGTLFDTPTFEWLDAYESKNTRFYVSLQKVTKGANRDGEAKGSGGGSDGGDRSPRLVVADGVCTSVDGMTIELF